jgi:DNA polymerase III epsilon subunit-like protein
MGMTEPGTLAARARAALEASADGVTPTELAGALFGVAATRLAPLVAQAASLLTRLESRGDAMLNASGRWVATDGVALPSVGPVETVALVSGGELRDDALAPEGPVSAIAVTFAGVRGGRPRLIEAALVRIEGGAEVMTWSSLANPDPEATGRVRLPMTVLERAGLEADAFEGAPSADAVVAELSELVAGTMVVGHDVATVLDALGALARWHGVAPPYRRGMTLADTEAMARSLLPDLARPSLDRVAAAVGVPPVRRDRAPERAKQVAATWRALVARAALAKDPLPNPGDTTESAQPHHRSTTLGDQVARGVLSRTAPGAALPEAPGIYRFHDGDGSVMYVGKATNLRGRVAQHFGGVGTSARGDALLSRVVTISHVVTACELDAALLEQATIGASRPPYNVQANAKQGAPYLFLDDGEPFPRVGGTHDPSSRPGSASFGPYRTAADARKVAQVVVRAFGIRPCTRKLPARSVRMRIPCLLYGQGICPAPCAPHVSPEGYGVAVSLARAFLGGGRDAALLAIDERLREMHQPIATNGTDPTEVGSRRWLERVRRALVRVRVDVRPLVDVPRGAWLALACRGLGRRGPGDAAVVTFLVRDGRLYGRREWRDLDGNWIAEPSGPAEADAARNAIISRRVQRDLGTPRVLVSRWGAPSEATLSAWVGGLGADPSSWEDAPVEEM